VFKAQVIRTTLFAFGLAALCLTPGLAKVTTADVDAFNDTLAAHSASCRPLVGVISVISAASTDDPTIPAVRGALVVEWSKAANAAKVCAIAVHAETSEPAPARLPHAFLLKACAFVKAHQAQAGTTLRAMTSWACGWPSPVPGFRPVPGIMPP
jgi:hypothetical protein